jgi:malonyl-CoA decarboxylase
MERMLSGMALRSVRDIGRAWRDLAGRTRTALTGRVRPELPEEDWPRLRRQLADAVRREGGELSGRTRAVELGMTYLGLTEAGRAAYLRILARDFGADPAALDAAMRAVQAAPAGADRLRATLALREALIPPRVRLFKLFHALPDGFAFLIAMRADLLPLVRREPEFEALDADLKALLAAWFDVGLLDLKPITWRSPAVLLEKLMAYEAVHAIRSWTDLKHRLNAPDRRCFGFFHHKLPGEPLIFVEVALTRGLAASIQDVLDEKAQQVDPAKADTAVFYSISSTQKGLAGINMGNFLIKRVVEELAADRPNLRTFSTLSPLPAFRHWLEADLSGEEAAALVSAGADAILKLTKRGTILDALRSALQTDWPADAQARQVLREPLLRLAAHYLVNVKRQGQAYDPVAHFHLRNGASLERLNWLADTSGKGLDQSAGIMVNYLYRPDEIDDNHERYAGEGRVTTSRSVRKLLVRAGRSSGG